MKLFLEKMKLLALAITELCEELQKLTYIIAI